MKKTMVQIICFISMTFLVCGCTGFQENRLGTLSAKLKIETSLTPSKSMQSGERLGSGAVDRIIKPSELWAPVRYAISGIGPGGNGFSQDGTDADIEKKLVPGEWTITVQAFSADDKEVASGTSMCLLQPGRMTIVTITMYPIDGIGDISLTIEKNFELPVGARITGTLTHKGLPGHPAPANPTVRTVDIAAEQTTLSFAGVSAGHYALILKLIASDGVVSGGCAQTIMVMAGFQTTGNCVIEMGMPLSYFSTELYPTSLLSPPLMSVKHLFSDAHRTIPLAIPSYIPSIGEEMERKWYLNGEEAGDAVRLVGNMGLLPEGTLAFPQSLISYPVSLLRADLVETSNTTFRTGSASVNLEAGSGNDSDIWGWRASYDFSAADGPSLYGMSAPNDIGTGGLYKAEAVAASPSGLIVVSGLDDDGALHAFAAGYGAEIDPLAARGSQTLSLDASWLRLWRDRIKINSSYKTANLLAISEDGRFIAAASSTSSSNWLRVSVLDEKGALLRSIPLAQIAETNDQYIKAIDFSSDGRKLYAALSPSNKIYSFDVNENSLIPIGLPLDLSDESLAIQDLKVAASGAIIVTARDASRIYVLSDEGGLAEVETIQGSSGGTEPYNPSSLAISKNGDAFYALCNSEEIVCYARANASSSYAQVSAFMLPSEVEGADFITAGKGLDDGAEAVFVAGTGNVEFFEIGEDMNLRATYPILAELWDLAGTKTVTGLCFTRGAFILAGGDSGKVSVFGAE